MKFFRNLKDSKLLASNWVITLTATLVGVLGALFLNEMVASKKLKHQKELATSKIISEILSNKTLLEESIDNHDKMLDVANFLNTYTNENDDLVTSVDSMNAFRKRYPKVKMEDSTKLDNGNYRYHGELNLDLSVTHINLSTIALETLKNSAINNAYNFNCLMYLGKVEKITNSVIAQDNNLFKVITTLEEPSFKNKAFLNQLDLLLNYEKLLNEVYDAHESELKNCD